MCIHWRYTHGEGFGPSSADGYVGGKKIVSYVGKFDDYSVDHIQENFPGQGAPLWVKSHIVAQNDDIQGAIENFLSTGKWEPLATDRSINDIFDDVERNAARARGSIMDQFFEDTSDVF